MKKLTREQYRDLFTKLPKEVQEFITSSDQTEKIFNLAERNHLHIDEAGILHDIVMDTAMGIIATKNLQAEIVRELKMNPLDVSRIVQEIDTEVFAPIKQIMVDTYKHSNPFKPQTLQHIEEHDEVDESQLNRDHLLAEIENPPESFKKREVSGEESAPASVPVVETEHLNDQTTTQTLQNDNLKQLSAKILGSIDTLDMPKVVTMQAHIPKTEEQPSIQTPKPVEISTTQENLIEVTTPEKAISATPVIPETKTMSAIDVNMTQKETVSTPKENITPKAVDPYREPLE